MINGSRILLLLKVKVAIGLNRSGKYVNLIIAEKLMAENCFHPSIEGAQHGAKSLAEFLDYAKKSGASGAQPSNYMLTTPNGLMSAKDIKDTFSKAKLTLDGVSAHCPIWVHT